ncbi:MAG: nitroreductase [Hyphomonas sp.]|uniref:nitroreductase family protein n=1 Tax=Hyphomonas sp. TaxID=87 RepID=UPI0035270A03
MLPVRPSVEARALLALRRSATKQFIGEPGPSPEALDELLEVAARVPDHRRLGPWRFIVFEGDARARFGDGLASILSARDAPAADIEEARMLLMRAPVVVAVISSPVDDGKTPVWEQELSAGAVCYNLLLAANASGWTGTWLSEWPAFDDEAANLLGLAGTERVAGFMYLGTATAHSPERPRQDMSAKITRWG